MRDSWRAGEAGVARPAGDVGAVLRIARFGAEWEVPIIEGMSDDALAAGVGHFFDSADVGEVGNYALAGHRITNGEPFRDLPDLVQGDEIVIETQRFDYTYVLDTDGDARRVSFTDTWVLDDRPINLASNRILTLTTCADLFHSDDRLVAFGHLASKEPAAPTVEQ